MSWRPGRTAVAVLTTAALLAAGCSSDEGSGERRESPSESGADSTGPGASAPPAKGSVTVERTVATGLKSPWGLAPLPGGDLLVSSRDTGEILRVDVGSGEKTKIGSVPGTDPGGEGGLLGLALRSDDADMLYAYVTTASDNRVVRMLYDPDKKPGNQLGAPDTIFKDIPKGTVHNGGRIAFGPDKMLYVGTGETGDKGLAQDKDSPAGKILRMTPDGEPPAHGNPRADSVVYSYGHRNVQGLAWDAENRLWAAEFGQDTWDELNLIRPGRNYGWPRVEGESDERGFVDPVAQWRTDEASPSGIAVAEGSVWMAALRGERLWRVPLRGTEPAAKPQDFLQGKYGRLRTVVSAGDDSLWLVTSETDSRGTPKKGDDRVLELTVR
ncbi:glucose sorbosone dehydrogenase [Streptomyces oceani]|uniref:Glucose sorbosone dehydrogenase n=1 Tax=Streptomyces oceani TaxID=1075402 RepID=A0A1E7KNK8_9ACTN|nr:PQQ-dependent sugar dehydrogenase [Streptomyces oceani]OEV05525.1 glucose sorbosone dehydrogenase [Streptomyces oceani]